MTLRVLVTGAGSVVGQGIIKALRLAGLPLTLVASDIAPLNAGLYRADEALILPKVESEGAAEAIIGAIRRHAIDAVLIGSEFDVAFFAAMREHIEAETPAKVVVSPPEVVALAHDKLRTAEFLRDNGLPFGEATAPADVDAAVAAARALGYPCVLKPRHGTSNRQVHVVESEAALRAAFPQVPAPMLQALIAAPQPFLDREYTCSIFKGASGAVAGPFTARRVLRGGSSWVVEVVAFSELRDLLLEIAERLPIRGPFNVQLMLTDRGPVPFEFNARFSGTTAIRAHFGFNDPAMAIQSFVLGEEVRQPDIRQGLALRYEEEVFIDGVDAEQLSTDIRRGEVHQWF